MKSEHLDEFVALGHCLSFTDASKRLGISQSSLSKHIGGLEKEIGCKLLVRGKHLRLTAAGSALFNDLIPVQHELHNALARCKEIDKRGNTELVVQLPYLYDATSEVVHQAALRFREAYPFVAAHFYTESSKTSIELLREGKLDIGLTVACSSRGCMARKHPISCEGDDGLLLFPLVEEPLFVWMDANNPLASKSVLSLGDISSTQINMPICRNYHPMRINLQRLFEAVTGEIPPINALPMECIDEFFMKTYRRASVFVITPSVARLPICSGKADRVLIPLADEEAFLTSYLVVREDYESEAVDQFLDEVAGAIENVRQSDESIRYFVGNVCLE